MNKNRFFTMTAFAAIVLPLAMTSCNNISDEEADDNLQMELRLSSGVEMQMRAAFPGTDVQIPYGENIAVYVDEAGGAVQLYEKNTLTANGSGSLYGGTPMFFPANGNSVDIYALHTNATFPTTYPTATLTHEVSADQRMLAGYAPSDLLYARRTNVAKTTSSVNLTFYHLLSKLQVAVKAGDGLTDTDIVGVTIGGMKLQANFSLDKTTAPNAVAITAAGTASPITIGADVSQDFTSANISHNDAIIVPQTLTANTVFVMVHLLDGSNLVYRLPVETTFQSGKKYEYQITANLWGLTLTTSIEDWVPVGLVTGIATME